MRMSLVLAAAMTTAALGGCANAESTAPPAPAPAETLGPFPFTCEGMTAPVMATFTNGATNQVRLVWPGHDITLPQGLSADGGRYTGTAEGGEWTFWNKGRGAMFTMPDGSTVNCNQAPGT